MRQEDNDNYDDYEDSQDKDKDPYKYYFKFDPDAWDAWGMVLGDALNDLIKNNNNHYTWYVYGWDANMFPAKGYSPDTDGSKNPQYLGVNSHKEPVFKKEYFIKNNINIMYHNHIERHASYFLQQPNYYKGLFDILN